MIVGNCGHLGYCTNIHRGESWHAVFSSLREFYLPIKKTISPHLPFGIGLRLSYVATNELLQYDHLAEFKTWLKENDLYVFTINGFPYGNFHGDVVKDKVHLPDWTSGERVAYTNMLFQILAELLPPGLDGGISTSPLSYRYRHITKDDQERVKHQATNNIMEVAAVLIRLQKATGKVMHLDIEPEPDGLLETSDEYIAFFEDYLLQQGAGQLATVFSCNLDEARDYVRTHVRLCYDVCHFAVGYERAADVIQKMEAHQLLIGKIQISAALRCRASDSIPVVEQQACLRVFDEPTYLHQAVVKTSQGELLRFRDLGAGIEAMAHPSFTELRTHFHVPIFTEQYRQLEATQSDIKEALQCWRIQPYTMHLEVETYTWDVLPALLQTGLKESIERELVWVIEQLKDENNDNNRPENPKS